MIKFSIITVCLNAGDDLIDTVTSTLAQTYENFEIIVKDGLSTDGSVERLPADPRIRLIRQKDTGIYDAMNQGTDEAAGDYLIFMNAGDKFYSDTVLEALAEGIGRKQASVYYGRCYNSFLDVIDPAPKKLSKYFCYRSMICHQATVYKADMLKARGYDTSYRVSADRERMLYAVIREKKTCVYLPVVVVSFQDGGFCTTEKAKRMLADEKERMTQEFYSPFEQAKYRIIHALTFPKLRWAIQNNPQAKKVYRTVISKLYGN